MNNGTKLQLRRTFSLHHAASAGSILNGQLAEQINNAVVLGRIQVENVHIFFPLLSCRGGITDKVRKEG